MLVMQYAAHVMGEKKYLRFLLFLLLLFAFVAVHKNQTLLDTERKL